jgi:hypothetical protein
MPHHERTTSPLSRLLRPGAGCLGAAALALALPAQTVTVVPAGFAGAGSSSSGSIWRAGLNRVQSIYDSTNFTNQGITAPVLVQRLQWRLADGLAGAMVTYPNVEIWLGDSANDHLAPSTTFANNRSGNHTAVYVGPVTVVQAAGTAPNTYVIDVLLTTPFLYLPSSGADLLVELVLQAPPAPATGSTISTSSSAATHRANSVRSLGSTTSPTGSLSPFCAVLKIDGTTTAPVEPVKINEFAYDEAPANGATDDEEYVEIYNPSQATSVDLTGWSLRQTGASGGETIWALPSQTIAPGGFRLFGSPTMAGANATFPSNDFLRNDHAGLELIDAYGRVVDAVAYEAFAGAWVGSPAETKGIFAPFVTEPAAATGPIAVAWSRVLDGHDTTESTDGYNAFDFHLQRQSRGATNSFAAGFYPYLQDCSALLENALVPEWGGSKLLPTAVTPGVLSPNLGPAIRFGTPVTGTTGAAYMLERRAERRISLDAYFRFDIAPTGEKHSWSIGARGTTDPEYHFPDAAGGAGDNGDVGLCWTYVSDGTTNTHTLYLIDKGDGGANQQVIADYDITAADWHRLRLESNGNRGIAYFGGTVGAFDGDRQEATIDDTYGNLWVGVRSTQPGYALLADGVRVQINEPDTVGIGPGCSGNCPRVNPRAARLEVDATIGELGLPENPNGTYRLELTPNTGTNSGTNTSYQAAGVRIYTQRLALPLTAATTTTTIVTLSNATNQSVLASGVLTVDPLAVENEPAWWSFTFPEISVNHDVFVDLVHTGELLLPIVDTITDTSGVTGSPTLFPADRLTAPTATIVAGWAVTLLCAGDTGASRGDADADAAVGDSTNFKLSGAGSNDLTIKLFGLVPGPIDLTPFGFSGCLLQMGNIDATIAMLTTVRGTANYVLTVPNVPAFSGLQLRSQWASLDPGLNALGFAFSDAVRVTIR